jgi:hypothetical protein
MQSDKVRSEMETRVSEILFYVWDPIGVNGMTACRDEYEHYVPIVSAYLLHRFEEIGLDALMMFIMEEYIGLRLSSTPRRKYQHQETMRMLMDWKADLFCKYPDARSAAPKFPKDESFQHQLDWSRNCILNRKNQHSISGKTSGSKGN